MRVVLNAKPEIGPCCLKQRILLLLLGDVVLCESYVSVRWLQLLISVAYILFLALGKILRYRTSCSDNYYTLLFPDNEAAMPPKLVSRNTG